MRLLILIIHFLQKRAQSLTLARTLHKIRLVLRFHLVRSSILTIDINIEGNVYKNLPDIKAHVKLNYANNTFCYK